MEQKAEEKCEPNIFTKLWKVKMTDWQRGLVCAILGMPFGVLYDWATQTTFVFSWRDLLKGAVAGGLAYIGKNFITGTNGKILSNK